MSELKEQQKPIMEKATKILDALDVLNELISSLDTELTPYLLPKTDERHEKETARNSESPISPLEEYLVEILDKIDYLKMKIKQIDSRIR